MILVARLVTATGYTSNIISRNIYQTLFQRELKVVYMSTIPLRELLCKHLRQQASGPEALLATHIDLVNANTGQITRSDFRKTIMEPYLNACYQANGLHSMNLSNPDSRESVTVGGDDSNRLDDLDPESGGQEHTFAQRIPSMTKETYNAMRSWKKINTGIRLSKSEANFRFRILSYNILAQNLLETHKYLYKYHDKEALPWEVRKKLILQEILDAQANVICLQEMDVEHMEEFVKPFQELGYDYLYKKRTNDKSDGLLFMYQRDMFNLVDHVKVEYFQSGIQLLSRDNVAIIAKLSLKKSPETQVVIATTHLLYNPRRQDVRLGQAHILLAEIERVAFIENSKSSAKYHPIVITGDFNLEPYTGVYEFITQGIYKYANKNRALEQAEYSRLSNYLIPPHLYVTDSSQHYHVLIKRFRNEGDGRIALENTERTDAVNTPIQNPFIKSQVNLETTNCQKIRISDDYCTTLGSGSLTHPFSLKSVYSHINLQGEPEATTYQDKWITVDYIFYSNLELVEKYILPCERQCKRFPTIPNCAVGSDHISLGATFRLRLK